MYLDVPKVKKIMSSDMSMCSNDVTGPSKAICATYGILDVNMCSLMSLLTPYAMQAKQH